MDLSTLTLVELKSLLNLVPAEIKRREKDEKTKALKDLEALAAERGFTLQDLIEGSAAKKARLPVAVKYRHPQQADLQWTGRGRQPKWVAEFLATGGSLEQLSV